MESAAQSRTPSVAPTLQRFIEAQRGTGMLLLWAIVVGVLAGLVGGLFRLSVSSLGAGLARVEGKARIARRQSSNIGRDTRSRVNCR